MLLTEKDYHDFENDYMGYCSHCDDFTRDCTEPDADNYDCPECGRNTVMGAMNALMMGYLDLADNDDLEFFDDLY